METVASIGPLPNSLMDLIMKRIRIIGSQQNGPNISTKLLISWRKGKSKRSSWRLTHWRRLAKAYERVAEGKARFRAVLTM